MIEPVIASAVAWLWLEEVLNGVQLLGGLLVLAGVGLVQVARSRADEPEPEPPLVGEATPVQ
jgi:drug/metabolite transporter (DMT)-like permease